MNHNQFFTGVFGMNFVNEAGKPSMPELTYVDIGDIGALWFITWKGGLLVHTLSHLNHRHTRYLLPPPSPLPSNTPTSSLPISLFISPSFFPVIPFNSFVKQVRTRICLVLGLLLRLPRRLLHLFQVLHRRSVIRLIPLIPLISLIRAPPLRR